MINYTYPEFEFSLSLIQILKSELIKSLKRRLDMILNDDIFAACTYLNFSFKNFEFIKDSTDREIHLDREKEYIRFYNRDLRKRLQKSPIVNDSVENSGVTVLSQIDQNHNNNIDERAMHLGVNKNLI